MYAVSGYHVSFPARTRRGNAGAVSNGDATNCTLHLIAHFLKNSLPYLLYV